MSYCLSIFQDPVYMLVIKIKDDIALDFMKNLRMLNTYDKRYENDGKQNKVSNLEIFF